jgi:hypothetical protein
LRPLITGTDEPATVSEAEKKKQDLEAWERDLVEREQKLNSIFSNDSGGKVIDINQRRRKAA